MLRRLPTFATGRNARFADLSLILGKKNLKLQTMKPSKQHETAKLGNHAPLCIRRDAAPYWSIALSSCLRRERDHWSDVNAEDVLARSV